MKTESKKTNVKTVTKTQRQQRELTECQKQKLMDKHIQLVQIADAAIGNATWKLADELAALATAYQRCHGKKPTGKQLARLTKLNRDGSRLALMAKLSAYFGPELRHVGVGLRVYEAAFKYNAVLKKQGRGQFAAAELAETLKICSSANMAKDLLEGAARARDGKEMVEEVKALKQEVMTNPKTAKISPKQWLKTYDASPPNAIAAAVKLLPRRSSIDKVNEALKALGVEYQLVRRKVEKTSEG